VKSYQFCFISSLFICCECLLFGEVTNNSVCKYRELQFCYKDAHARLLGHLHTWMHLVKRQVVYSALVKGVSMMESCVLVVLGHFDMFCGNFG